MFDDISCIIYQDDTFGYNGGTIHNKQIDIAFSFGECHEISQTDPAFQRICDMCSLAFSEQMQEFIIYQK